MTTSLSSVPRPQAAEAALPPPGSAPSKAGEAAATWALSLLAGRNDGIDIPLDFSRGLIWIGPVPVMDSPVFVLR